GLALAVLSPSALDAAVRPAPTKACLDSVLGKETAPEVSALTLTTTATIKGTAMKAVMVSLALIGLGIGIYPSFGRADPPKPIDDRKTEEPKATAMRDTGARPEPITLEGHSSEVASACFSPDGKRIVTGGGELPRPGKARVPGEVKVWD